MCLLITSRYIAMQSYECVIISKMFFIYFISYGCNGGALVFLGGAEASASPSFALPMCITIKKKKILHLFLGVPAATVGGTGTPWHTRGYAPATECQDLGLSSHPKDGYFYSIVSRHYTAEVLCSSPRAPPLCIFCMSLFVNTPDSDNQLVRSALHA